MKTLKLLLASLFFTNILFAQSIGIGNNSPHASAILDVSSTSKGILIPRMNSGQRTGIASPAPGLLVYDSDTKSFWYHNATAWTNMAGGGAFSLPYDATVNLNVSAFKITNGGSGPAIQAVTTNEFGYALQASNSTNYGYSVYAYSRSPNAIGVYSSVDSSTAIKGVSTNGIGVHAISTDSIAIRAAIVKAANADPVLLATHAGAGTAVDGISQTGYGVRGVTSTASSAGAGIYGENNGTQGSGVQGVANFASGFAVKGESNNGIGVYGYSGVYRGVSASTISGTALYAFGGSGYGLEVSGKVKISGGNTNPSNGAVLTSDATGNAVWKQDRVAFGVQGVNTNYVSIPHSVYRRINFGSNGLYDLSNSYQLLAGINELPNSSSFIVPVFGVYHFDLGAELATINYDNAPTITQAELRLRRNSNGTTSTLATNLYPEVITDGPISNARLTISRDFILQSGDIIWVEIYHKNATSQPAGLGDAPYTYFNGHLVKSLQ